MIKLKRVYEKVRKEDGFRILVDRLWPRGLSKKKAKIDLWLKEIAPTDNLRKCFHETGNWVEFKNRYKEQLKTKKREKLIKKIKQLEKEKELKDFKKAKEKYNIQGIVTGALASVYQATRIQKICNKLNLECFNPLWQKNQIKLLNELIENDFKIVLTGVFSYPFDSKWLGRKINETFINEIKNLQEKYKINPAGEGGEYETFVLDCPLFKRKLKIKNRKINGKGNSWRMGIEIK